jgi:predicted DNA-binding transcriptional regulator AlpA|tara:strand:- start:23326 stop:23556 length:231 start_codon:yes stop_codon:yes gene_type:complete
VRTSYKEILDSGVNPILDTRGLAKFLELSTYTVIDYRRKKIGPKYHRIGRSIRYQLVEVLDWLNSHEVNTEQDATL